MSLPSTARDRRQHGPPSQGDSLIQFVYDRQKSQITENVIWKLKNGEKLNEKLSIYFCNIDFFISLKNVHFEHFFFFPAGEKNIAQYIMIIPLLKKLILMQLHISFVQQ